MSVSASHPTPPPRLWRCFFALVAGLWAVCCTALVLAVLAWALIYFYLAPHIAQYKPLMERVATQKLGLSLSIDHISASRDWIPQFQLEGVTVHDKSGHQAIHLPQVFATITPRSLLRLNFATLTLVAPNLEVRRDAQGRIFVGGIDMGQGDKDDADAAADWFFSLTRFEVEDGRLLWIDEKRHQDPLALQAVRIGVHNNHWGRHDFFLAATPPEAWGEPFTLQANLHAPFGSLHAGAWRNWKGLIYADLPYANVAQLGHYLDGQVDIQRGVGAVRSWADFDQGSIRGVTLDVAVARATLRLAPDLPYLDLQDVQGRLQLARLPQGLLFTMRDLQLTTSDGTRWPASDLSLQWQGTDTPQENGKMIADGLNLQALAQLAERLPLAPAWRSQLLSLHPQGQIQKMSLTWQGALTAPTHYQAQGQIKGLALAAQALPPPATVSAAAPAAPATTPTSTAPIAITSVAAQADSSAQSPENTPKLPPPLPPSPGRPGFAGATIDFSLTEKSGQAQVQIENGWLEFPGIFAEPRIPLDRLSATVNWQIQGSALSLGVQDMRFANADAQGSAHATWHSSAGEGAARFPGVLDLQGQLDHGLGQRVWRYLPLQIPQTARDYVQHAVQAGQISQGHFKIQGDLADLPSREPNKSTFHIDAQIDQGYYDYVPSALLPAGSKPWPAFSQLSGTLIFDGYGMQVRNATGLMNKVQVRNAEATLADLENPSVAIQGDLSGDLDAMVQTVRSSALDSLLTGALSDASGSGPSTLALQLQLPIAHLEKSSVRGHLQLQGNTLRIQQALPTLSQAQGGIRFDEQGFVLDNLHAQALGGPLHLTGGMGALAAPAKSEKNAVSNYPLRIEGKGIVRSEALRSSAAGELPPAWAGLAPYLQGAAPYDFTLSAQHGHIEANVSSTLQGMAVRLPAPLNKDAGSSQPLHLQWQSNGNGSDTSNSTTSAAQEQWRADWGNVLSAQYLIKHPAQSAPNTPPQVRGLINIGTPNTTAHLPDSGVLLNIQTPQLALADWNNAFPAQDKNTASSIKLSDVYWPNQIHLQAGHVSWNERSWNAVDAHIERKPNGNGWKIALQSQELSGQIDYLPSDAQQAGQLNAHLQHLDWTQTQADQWNDKLNTAPDSIPALNVVVDDFSLRGKALGKLEIVASNSGHATDINREWRLDKLNISNPESQFQGNGVWMAGRDQGRTVLNFKWAVQDGGHLLERLGQKDVLAKTKGSLDGQISWQGAITSPNYPSMNGQLQLNFSDGRFLKADPGIAKLLGVLNLQALPRRLTLDFRDVFSQGFSFDALRGDIHIQQGVASTNNLQMKGLNAAVLMEGWASIKDETQDLHVVVVPEINAGTASLIATAINPAVGIGSFLAQWLLSKPIDHAATQEFHITGNWSEPKIEKMHSKVATPTPTPTPTPSPAMPNTSAKP